MCAFSFTVFLSAFQLLPTAPYRILELGGSEVAAGMFLGFLTYASALSAPITGSLADRVGRRRMLIGCSLVLSAFAAAYALTRDHRVLLALALAHGCFWSGLLSSSSAYITDFIPAARRSEGIGYWGLSTMFAIVFAPSLGFWLYHRGGWMWLCASVGILNLVMAAIAFQLVEVPRAPSESAFFGRHLVEWRVLALSLTLFLYSFGYGAITSFAALYADASGVAPKEVFFTTFAIVVLATRPVLGPLGDRVGYRRVFIPCLVMITAGLALLAREDVLSDHHRVVEVVLGGHLARFGDRGQVHAPGALERDRSGRYLDAHRIALRLEHLGPGLPGPTAVDLPEGLGRGLHVEDVGHPGADEALLGLPHLVGLDGLRGHPVHFRVGIGQRGGHAADGDGAVLETDRDQPAEDVGQERRGLDVHPEAVRPHRAGIGHHELEDARLEIPARRVEAGRVGSQRVEHLLHLVDRGQRLDERDRTDRRVLEERQERAAPVEHVAVPGALFGPVHLGQVEVDALPARLELDVLADRDRFMRTREDIRSVYDAEQAISEYEALMSAMIARG